MSDPSPKEKIPGRPGPAKGTRHAGSFSKGTKGKGTPVDPRINRHGPYVNLGTSAAEAVALARQSAPAAMRFLTEVMQDEDEATRHRIAAANLLLDRAYGKAPSSIEVKTTDAQAVAVDALSTEELVALGADLGNRINAALAKHVDGQVIDQEDATDAEFTEVNSDQDKNAE
jgi:hypothetical protein